MSTFKTAIKEHMPVKVKAFIKRWIFVHGKSNYDAAIFVNPNEFVCNLFCEYCPFLHERKSQSVPPLDCTALLSSLDKTGKTFLVSLCGNGETFLVPNSIEACQQITRQHYLTLTTNLTTANIKTFCELIPAGRVLGITASLHIKELERLHLTDTFIANFQLCKRNRFNITAWEVAYPSLLSEVQKYLNVFRRKGIKLHFGEFRGEYKGKQYPEAYTDYERKIFDLPGAQVSEHQRRQLGQLCNAGYNVCCTVEDGTVYPCFKIKEKLGSIQSGFQLKKQMLRCPIAYCECPLNAMNEVLFLKAKIEANP